MMHTIQIFLSLALGLLLSAGLCKSQSPQLGATPEIVEVIQKAIFDRQAARTDLKKLTEAPHPMGSDRQREMAAFLKSRAEALGFRVAEQAFTAVVPNETVMMNPLAPAPLTFERQGQNLYAFTGIREHPDCVVLVGSHYDTKPLRDASYLGANDGGSSSAGLLQLLKMVKDHSKGLSSLLQCEIVGVWFDGEEATLYDWFAGERLHPSRIVDHTYGSRRAVSSLVPCPQGGAKHCLSSELGGGRVAALVLLDMIGSPDIKLTRDERSSPELVSLSEKLSSALFSSNIVSSRPAMPMEDDHSPFLEAGIPSVDLIDFEHLEYWHRPGDDFARVSLESIERAVRLGASMALELASKPHAIVAHGTGDGR